jgi:hypothetical protein
MKTINWFIILLFILFPHFVIAEDGGSVCLGPFLGKAASEYEPSTQPYVTIGDSGPFHFEQRPGNQSPVLIIEGLALEKTHTVKVHFKGKIVESWGLNFEKVGSNSVRIWRSAGAWRMDPIKDSACTRK